MNVIACGTTVETKIGKITGIVTAVTIRFKAVAYEISYFAGNHDRKEVWLNENEFTVQTENKQTIGFIK